uniref:Lipocln_cytosolic_FA-bd_dom domain-containing protein n=1 Tax=Angiostrongylus cantonensis TaxID=6313 RepID=A0A158P8F7_ANGCA
MGDVQLGKLMGKWYTVVDTTAVHPEECAVHYFELLMETNFTGTFSSLLYASHKAETVAYQGFGRMVGPDPGELFYTTGHPSDHCPYFPVKMGGLNSHGEYEYMILSQPLKYPTFVLARDLKRFENKYKPEVYSFLEKHGFLSPIASLNTRLHFENVTACNRINQYYDQMLL